jgi:hypothetical protein
MENKDNLGGSGEKLRHGCVYKILVLFGIRF